MLTHVMFDFILLIVGLLVLLAGYQVRFDVFLCCSWLDLQAKYMSRNPPAVLLTVLPIPFHYPPPNIHSIPSKT